MALMIAGVAIPVRLVSVLTPGLAIFSGIVPLFPFSISVVATVAIAVGSISPVAIVVTILVFARGKVAGRARGEHGRC